MIVKCTDKYENSLPMNPVPEYMLLYTLYLWSLTQKKNNLWPLYSNILIQGIGYSKKNKAFHYIFYYSFTLHRRYHLQIMILCVKTKYTFITVIKWSTLAKCIGIAVKYCISICKCVYIQIYIYLLFMNAKPWVHGSLHEPSKILQLYITGSSVAKWLCLKV